MATCEAITFERIRRPPSTMAAGVATLIDVREVAWSRRAEYAKKALADALARPRHILRIPASLEAVGAALDA